MVAGMHSQVWPMPTFLLCLLSCCNHIHCNGRRVSYVAWRAGYRARDRQWYFNAHFAGIVAGLPRAAGQAIESARQGDLNWLLLLVIAILAVAIVWFVVLSSAVSVVSLFTMPKAAG